MKKRLVLLAGMMVLAFVAVGAEFPPASKLSVNTLKITRGKKFETGVVFVNGKYLAPPYQVERYGNVIRINGVQVTGEVVPWEAFLRTQTGLKISKTETSAPAPAAAPSAPDPAPAPATASTISTSASDDDLLADLFDDAPAAPAKKKASPSASAAPRSPKPVVTTTYKLDGDFVMNDRADALKKKINDLRTSIDKELRGGGFFCFGADYSRVNGSKAQALKIVEKLSVIMKTKPDFEEFSQALRAAGFEYFPPALVRDLHANRLDYFTLEKRLKHMKVDERYNDLMDLYR